MFRSLLVSPHLERIRFPAWILGGVLAPAILLGGCTTTYTPPRISLQSLPASTGNRGKLLKNAFMALGTPYHYGGDTPSAGFDCSGLIYWASHRAGYYTVPRTVREQYRELHHVYLSHLRPGDLLFFRFNHYGPPTHVGLYIGHGKFIHAPQTGGVVDIATLHNPFWKRHLISAARPPR